VYLSQNQITLLVLLIVVTFAILALMLIALVYLNGRANVRRQMELVKTAFDSQEQERARIARDLHDSIGQQISAIRLHIGLLNEIESKQQMKEAIADKQKMLGQVNEELRMITRNLLPRTITEYGLSAALDELKKSLTKTNNIILNIKLPDENVRYKPDFEINIFRILQEMINNTIKYADATSIYIEMWQKDDQLELTYYDNGLGFDPGIVSRGMGLKNIEARVSFYNGDHDMTSSRRGGTRFKINFDLEEIMIG
jgi:signal transduction histidine kinase